MEWAKHTCFDEPDHDGTMSDNCAGCVEAAENRCTWCGYGHAFPTHNPIAHIDNEDPVLISLCGDRLDCENVFEDFFDTQAPYVEATFHNN